MLLCVAYFENVDRVCIYYRIENRKVSVLYINDNNYAKFTREADINDVRLQPSLNAAGRRLRRKLDINACGYYINMGFYKIDCVVVGVRAGE